MTGQVAAQVRAATCIPRSDRLCRCSCICVGNGLLQDEAAETQQSLFSWAEFIAEEPVKPKGRGRKPQPASTSLFDWALSLEREKEPVGAGR